MPEIPDGDGAGDGVWEDPEEAEFRAVTPLVPVKLELGIQGSSDQAHQVSML